MHPVIFSHIAKLEAEFEQNPSDEALAELAGWYHLERFVSAIVQERNYYKNRFEAELNRQQDTPAKVDIYEKILFDRLPKPDPFSVQELTPRHPFRHINEILLQK